MSIQAKADPGKQQFTSRYLTHKPRAELPSQPQSITALWSISDLAEKGTMAHPCVHLAQSRYTIVNGWR